MFTIACIGNSHTAGFPSYDPVFGGNPESTYIFHLERKLKNENGIQVVFTNHGICGQTSGLITRRIPNILKKVNPTHAILLSGANDIGWGMETSKTVKNIAEAIELLGDNACVPVLCNIPPMTLFFGETDTVIQNRIIKLNNRLYELAGNKSAVFVDLWENLVDMATGGLQLDFDSGDGVHLNVEGYKRVAEKIHSVILPLFV